MQKLLQTLILTLVTAASATLSAAPVGYSINSDSTTSDPDHLYKIDLASGAVVEHIGAVRRDTEIRLDVEGLAFNPNGLLYGIDDETLKLFRINPATAQIDSSLYDYQIIGGSLTPKENDFGMTFACDGTLYVTSVAKQSLYHVDITAPNIASATRIGAESSLGLKISAIAAYGNPTRLFGLSNGTAGVGGGGTPSLYEINTTTGVATKIGALGNGVASYAEAGLSFDGDGQLWAITDRSSEGQSSQVMRINTSTGAASDIKNTTEQGFESLAISTPRGCAPVGTGDLAHFFVQKRFTDGNNITPVKLNIKCNAGPPFEQSLTVLPNEGAFGSYEAIFNVRALSDGSLDCEVWEATPPGYTAEYDCLAGPGCSISAEADACVFQNVPAGQQNLCLIHNEVNPVKLTVTKEWLYDREEMVVEDAAVVKLICSNVLDGDGTSQSDRRMSWLWTFDGNPASQVATLYPDFAGKTRCRTEESPLTSAVESESTCSSPVVIRVGDKERSCTVTNTVFFEGIPTLNPFGLALVSALVLLTGLISVRRVY